MAEETTNASRAAPLAIMAAVFGTSFTGLALCLVTTFSITDVSSTAASSLGVPFAQVLYDHLGRPGMLALFSLVSDPF